MTFCICKMTTDESDQDFFFAVAREGFVLYWETFRAGGVGPQHFTILGRANTLVGRHKSII